MVATGGAMVEVREVETEVAMEGVVRVGVEWGEVE